MANTHSVDFELSSSQYAKITDVAQTGLDAMTDLTISAWINMESLVTNTIVAKSDTGQLSYWFYYAATGGNQLVFYSSTNGSLEIAVSEVQVLPSGEWHHVAVTRNGTSGAVQLYYDGLPLGSQHMEKAGAIHDGTAEFRIGARQTGLPYYWDGRIDDVRVWSTVRTAEQIRGYHCIELAGTESGLEGYWKLDNDYTDETANSNDLTAVAAPTFGADVPTFATDFTPVKGMDTRPVDGGIVLAID